MGSNKEAEALRHYLVDWAEAMLQKDSGKGDSQRFVCPMCGTGTGKNKTSQMILPTNNSNGEGWYCKGCDKKGDLFTLVGYFYGVDSFKEKSALIRRDLHIDGIVDYEKLPSPKATPIKKVESKEPTKYQLSNREKNKTMIASAQSRIGDDAAASYLQSRGIDIETARKWGLGFNPKTYWTNREYHPSIVIPYPDEDGYYTARAIDGADPKYYIPSKKYVGMGKPIFNIKAAKKTDVLFVVEGQLDALALMETGQAAIACSDTGNQAVVDCLMDYDGAVVVALDNDDDPKKGKAKQVELIQKLSNVGIVAIGASISDLGAKDCQEAWQKDFAALKVWAGLAESNAKAALDSRPAPFQETTGTIVYMKDESASGESEFVNASVVEDDDNAILGFDMDKGRVVESVYNVGVAISMSPSINAGIKYDTYKDRIMVVETMPWDADTSRTVPRGIDDFDRLSFRTVVEHSFSIKKKEVISDALTLFALQNPYNSMVEKLDSLGEMWDGKPRLYTLLTVMLGAAPNAYNAEVMTVFAVAAVARTYNPGTPFRYMPVLEGAQALGKSTFLKMLALGEENYISVRNIEKERAEEKLFGRMIGEFEELDAFKKVKEQTTLKAFVTTTSDTVHKKYSVDPEDSPRTCVFAGTTNDKRYLVDKTGNSRYLPVECGVYEPMIPMLDSNAMQTDEAVEYFRQAMGEAVTIYKSGDYSLYLSEENAAIAEKAQDDMMVEDVREGMIQCYLDDLPNTVTTVCLSMICEKALHMEPREYQGKRSVTNEVCSIMDNRVVGWVRCETRPTIKPYGKQTGWQKE